jgi:hypothetical protein
MITITILIVLWFIYSVYKIKQTCGKWKEFNPFNAGFTWYLGFALGLVYAAASLVVAAAFGIIP